MRYESTGGWCWAAAKMRTADTMVVRFVYKFLRRLGTTVSFFAESHFLRPVASHWGPRRRKKGLWSCQLLLVLCFL